MKQPKKINFFKFVLNKLFDEYKVKLRLNKNWKIKFNIKEEKNTYAKVEYFYKDRDFLVTINPEMNETVVSLENSIIHEFFHILLSSSRNRFERALDKIDQGKKIDTDKLRECIINEEERLVRKLTRIIVDYEKELDKNI